MPSAEGPAMVPKGSMMSILRLLISVLWFLIRSISRIVAERPWERFISILVLLRYRKPCLKTKVKTSAAYLYSIQGGSSSLIRQ